MGEIIQRDGIRIHYLRHLRHPAAAAGAGPGSGPAMILLHGLTANAHSFDGMVQAGLCAQRSALALDLRGRGLSDKPATGYTLADHAGDVLALMDQCGIERTAICGHSYGALLAMYLAAEHPERVSRIVLIDIAGPTIQNSAALELLKPSLARLGKSWPSMDAFLQMIRNVPFLHGMWDETLERFWRADVDELDDGTVRVRTPPEAIGQVIASAQGIDWNALMRTIAQPAVLFHASGSYGPPGSPPLVLAEQAREAADLLGQCRYVHVPGNHMTMMFGEGARAMVAELQAFL